MKTFAVLCTAWIAAAPLAAQRPSRPATPAGWPAFVQAFDAYAATDSVMGGSVLVMRDGRVVAHHEYGWADRAAGQRVDTNTIFHYGSITKTLTAIAILQLRDRGRLTLDDPVTRWVPELRQVHDPFGPMDAVTIRMLLSHSAGFQDPTWPYGQGRPWEPFEPTRWEQLVAMMPYQEVAFPPGSRYSYSNPGFIYLARILEAITGDPYQAYVYKNLWGPLGLTRSYFGTTPYHLAAMRSNTYAVEADSAGRITMVTIGRDFDPGITIPNGGWNAPLGDLARYVAFLTGAAPSDTVLARASLEEMWRATLSTEGAAVGDSVGLSFFVRWRGGTRFIGHTGHQAGFRSFLYFEPRTRVAVIGVFNTTNDARGEASAAGFTALRDAGLEMLLTPWR